MLFKTGLGGTCGPPYLGTKEAACPVCASTGKQWSIVLIQPKRFNKGSLCSRIIHFWCPLGHLRVCNNKEDAAGVENFCPSQLNRAHFGSNVVYVYCYDISALLSAHQDPNSAPCERNKKALRVVEYKEGESFKNMNRIRSWQLINMAPSNRCEARRTSHCSLLGGLKKKGTLFSDWCQK